MTANGSGAYAIYVAGTAGVLTSDYNDLYASGTAKVGRYVSDDALLSDWQTATGLDLNSVSADPWFANAGAGDLHVMSTVGRYNPATNQPPSNAGAWVVDNRSSPGIDRGNPATTWTYLEPAPNGARVNMGAYGNTEQASKTDLTSPGLKAFPDDLVVTIDSGVNNTDRVTNDANLTLAVGFNEFVVGVATDITVTNPSGGNVPVTITEWAGSPPVASDTIHVTINSLPLSANGTYTVTIKGTIKDAFGGNLFNGGTNVTRTFTFDNGRPTVTGYSIFQDTGASSTDQITKDPKPGVTFNFSEPVYGSASNVTVVGATTGAMTTGTLAGWGTTTLTLQQQGNFTSTLYMVNGSFATTIADAEAVITTPSRQASMATEWAPYINYISTPGEGHFYAGGADNVANRPFPGRTIGVDDNNFVVVMSGILHISVAGIYSFDVDSDDGFRLTIYGANFTSNTGGSGRNNFGGTPAPA